MSLVSVYCARLRLRSGGRPQRGLRLAPSQAAGRGLLARGGPAAGSARARRAAFSAFSAGRRVGLPRAPRGLRAERLRGRRVHRACAQSSAEPRLTFKGFACLL